MTRSRTGSVLSQCCGGNAARCAIVHPCGAFFSSPSPAPRFRLLPDLSTMCPRTFWGDHTKQGEREMPDYDASHRDFYVECSWYRIVKLGPVCLGRTLCSRMTCVQPALGSAGRPPRIQGLS
jgi:hypothetical protein